MMWRTDFRGEPGNPAQQTANLVQYVKHPFSGHAGNGKQEDNYYYTDPGTGERIEIQSGRWYRITQLGENEQGWTIQWRIIAFLNGKRVLDKRGLTFRYTPDLSIDLLYFTNVFVAPP